jgi:hypothetical protein
MDTTMLDVEQAAGETHLFFMFAAANGGQVRKGNDKHSFSEFSRK